MTTRCQAVGAAIVTTLVYLRGWLKKAGADLPRALGVGRSGLAGVPAVVTGLLLFVGWTPPPLPSIKVCWDPAENVPEYVIYTRRTDYACWYERWRRRGVCNERDALGEVACCVELRGPVPRGLLQQIQIQGINSAGEGEWNPGPWEVCR